NVTGATPISTKGFTIVVVTVPTLTDIIGNVVPEYLLKINLENTIDTGCAVVPDPTQPVPGVILIDGLCFNKTTNIWIPAGVHKFVGWPYRGYAFGGWTFDSGIYFSDSTIDFDVERVLEVGATFFRSKRVSFRTHPGGLPLIVDHNAI